MDAESFFARWSKRNAEAAAEKRAAEEAAATAAAELRSPVPKPPPTLDDVARLTHDSDFTSFVASGVDEDIRRSAMKKLFSDPRFNVMDGLDVYIEDYNKFTPIPAAILAALNHARSLLDPLAHLDDLVTKQPDVAALGEDHDSAMAPDESLEPDTPPPEEQNSHDDPVQGM